MPPLTSPCLLTASTTTTMTLTDPLGRLCRRPRLGRPFGAFPITPSNAHSHLPLQRPSPSPPRPCARLHAPSATTTMACARPHAPSITCAMPSHVPCHALGRPFSCRGPLGRGLSFAGPLDHSSLLELTDARMASLEQAFLTTQPFLTTQLRPFRAYGPPHSLTYAGPLDHSTEV